MSTDLVKKQTSDAPVPPHNDIVEVIETPWKSSGKSQKGYSPFVKFLHKQQIVPQKSMPVTESATKHQVASFWAFPEELLLRMMSSLPYPALVAAACSCREGRRVAEQSYLWQLLCEKRWGLGAMSVTDTWRASFIRRLKVESIPEEERAQIALKREASFISELDAEELLLDDEDDE